MIGMTRLIPMPQALGEVVFTGRESSIAISQAPSRLAGHDWMIITGQAGDRLVQIAITRRRGSRKSGRRLLEPARAGNWIGLARTGTRSGHRPFGIDHYYPNGRGLLFNCGY
jgi:hypothetical protein